MKCKSIGIQCMRIDCRAQDVMLEICRKMNTTFGPKHMIFRVVIRQIENRITAFANTLFRIPNSVLVTKATEYFYKSLCMKGEHWIPRHFKSQLRETCQFPCKSSLLTSCKISRHPPGVLGHPKLQRLKEKLKVSDERAVT